MTDKVEFVNRVTGEVVAVPSDVDVAREQAILEYVSQKEVSDSAYTRLLQCKAALLPYILSLDTGDKSTGYLDSVLGASLQIQFKDSATWDTAALAEAEKTIPKTFAKLFSVEVKYKPRLRDLNKWLVSQSSDELENIAREVIRGARKESGTRPEPYIKVMAKGGK